MAQNEFPTNGNAVSVIITIALQTQVEAKWGRINVELLSYWPPFPMDYSSQEAAGKARVGRLSIYLGQETHIANEGNGHARNR